jgi:hypothetical protein
VTLFNIISDTKKVRFNDNVIVIHEPPELSDDLRKSRKSDYLHRQADRARYELMLQPIFTNTHRTKIFIRNKLI